MKAFAKRSQQIQPSSTLAVTSLAKKLKAEGQDVISLGAGEPDFDTPENIKEAAQTAINNGQTKYTPVGGTPALKNAIIEKLKRDNNLSYEAENILITNGGKQALFNAIMTLVESGDEVLIPAPYWVSYPEQVRVFDGNPVILETSDATDFKITAEQLENAITDKTKVLVLNSPSNPTGAAYSREELQKIAEICVKHDLYVISDEIYEHIVYDGFEHVSIASFSEDIKARTLIASGASKCYAMTGWRMGFAAGPKELIKVMSNIQGQSTSNVCSITQAACVEAFTGPQDVVFEMRKAFDERRRFVVEELNSIPGLTCNTPHGAFYAFPNISFCFGKETQDGKKIQNSQDFCVYLLEKHLVACVHGSAFGADDYMRLSYATSLENLKAALQRIKVAVAELQ